MIKETVISRSVRLMYTGGIVAALGLTAQSAMAQQAAPEGQKIQRVEVTGSNIRRSEAETSTPVQVLSRVDIEKSGKTSVAELLQTLAVDNQGSVPTTFGNGFAAGASGISLRGLGVASTLVLLNGRRIAPYGLADDGQKVFADLNLIPMEAVDRVEIVKDGASSIYGSDAIAGVVNIILRKDYQGTAIKGSFGESRYSDGKDTRLALTHGFGDMATDGYNFLLNAEYGKKNEVWYRNRADRSNYIGYGDLRGLGFNAQQGLGGTGAITGPNAAGSAINGNVRNPLTNNYYNRGNPAGVGFTRTFPAAACSNFTSHAQGDPGGGCLIDAAQVYNQMQPKQENYNLFGRGTLRVNGDMQAYAELNYYNSKSDSSSTPSGISSSVGYPGGPVSSADIALGANHPDNPYFGTAARLRYLAADVGPRTSHTTSDFVRAVAGLQGTLGSWDFDTALLYSQSKAKNSRNGYLQRDVMYALLNPASPNGATAINNPAYAALPKGSLWRIGENAGLNSAALYAALSPTISSNAKTEVAQIDFKATRELFQLPGGTAGLAAGAEFRHESTRLDPTEGTDKGNIVGLGYSAYDGARNLSAVYAEVLAPIVKTVELSAAVRNDHYSDVGNSFTPKLGAKWQPAKEFALRGTYSKGFRAPSAAENGKGGLAAYSTASDPVRCALGVTTACSNQSVAIITSPNPDLQPEKSTNYSAGIIWDVLPRTSLGIDLWQITRKNEINQESTATAIANGQVARDPSTSTKAGDPGAIIAVLANYVNSTQTKVRGIDVDFRQGFILPEGYGKLNFDVKWTHLYTFARTDDGETQDYAGTHGNCDVTNCMGTPADRVNLGATWERGNVRVAATANYRGALENVLYKNDPDGCASSYANGDDAPHGCKISSFTTLDLTFRWKATTALEVFGGIQNVTDKVAPFDPLTYGATGYNPLDYAGALGRSFSVGAKYRF